MPLMPVLSIVLVVLLVVGAWWLFRVNREVFLKVVIGVLAAVVVALIASYFWISAEVASQIEVLNPAGVTGKALVVYHAGRSNFQERVTYAFAEALVSNGWRVEITTASAQAPTDLTPYDLLVVGGPTYYFVPARPIRNYVRRLGDLGGQPTATIVTGMGAGGRSASVMEKQVREANGDLVKALLLYTLRPNEDLYGINDAEEIATQAGKEIPAPGD